MKGNIVLMDNFHRQIIFLQFWIIIATNQQPPVQLIDTPAIMNKENSRFLEEEASTEVHQTNQKGYSSRYQRLKGKALRKGSIEPLPIRVEKSAIIIQRYYRFRMFMKRKVYERYLAELACSNGLKRFQNSRDKQTIKSMESEIEFCKMKNNLLIKDSLSQQESLVRRFIRQCVASAFRMEKKMVAEQSYVAVIHENQALEKRIGQLQTERDIIKRKILQEFNEDQELHLREIRQESSIVLIMVTERNELERKLKEMMVQISRAELPPSEFRIYPDY